MRGDVPEFAAPFLGEWQISLELTAAGVAMRPRVRVVGADSYVITLPRDEWRLGRTLAALTPFAMSRLARALVISVQNDNSFESWLLCREEGPKGLRTTVEWSPLFKVVETRELRSIADAPPLVQRFAWACLREPREVDLTGLASAESIFAADGLCPARQIGWKDHAEGHA